jgi:hypothetical protein
MMGRVHSDLFAFRGAFGLTDLIYIGKPVLDAARNLAARAKGSSHAPVGS